MARAKYSKRCVRDAILILDICAMTPGYPTLLDAARTTGLSERATWLALRAWWHASRRHHEAQRITDAIAASYLRDGWLPD